MCASAAKLYSKDTPRRCLDSCNHAVGATKLARDVVQVQDRRIPEEVHGTQLWMILLCL